MSIRILVIDADQDVCTVMGRLLEREGYQVTTCTDSGQVLQLLRSSRYNLVILECVMPCQCGIELLQDIRGEDEALPVVFTTCYPSMDTAIPALKLQASDYLKKPFEPVVLLRAVREALSSPGKAPEDGARSSIVVPGPGFGRVGPPASFRPEPQPNPPRS